MSLTSISMLLAQSADGPVSTRDLEGGSLWMPNPASTIAGDIDWMFNAIYWLSLVFFVLIVGVMGWFVVKYRRRSPDEKAGSDITHNTPLEVTWTIIPLLLSVAIFYVGLEGYVRLRETPANAYEVNVTGYKWAWNFEHRNGAQSTGWVRVPAGRPVQFTMTGTDVLHSFYIPAFRVKKDVVPGRYSTIWFQADEPGLYQALCTEYCGTSHSLMTAVIEVMDPAEFDRQIAEDAAWLDKVDEGDAVAMAEAGARLYARCQSCHSVDGSRMSGPSYWETHDLLKSGGKRQLADGSSVDVDINYIRTSILVPGEHVVATYANAMPSFQGQLDEKAIRALYAFIDDLDTIYDRDGNRLAAD